MNLPSGLRLRQSRMTLNPDQSAALLLETLRSDASDPEDPRNRSLSRKTMAGFGTRGFSGLRTLSRIDSNNKNNARQ
jgi:hypothetical protein